MIDISLVYSNGQCADHPLPELNTETTETIIAAGRCNCHELNLDYTTCGSWCDTNSFAIGLLSSGKFVVVEEWSDSSGHGCQCSGSLITVDSFSEALKNLTQETREWVVEHRYDSDFDLWVRITRLLEEEKGGENLYSL